MARALVPLVDGFEEIEAVSVIDILRRAGVDVVTAGVDGDSATGSHAITVRCDARLDDVRADRFDAIVLPGGPGTPRLRDSAVVRAVVTRHHAAGRLVAAVCAAPTVLAAFGLLEGRRATCFPGCESDLAGARFETTAVVEDGNVITSRGAGTSIEFAAAIVARLVSPDAAREVLARIVYAR